MKNQKLRNVNWRSYLSVIFGTHPAFASRRQREHFYAGQRAEIERLRGYDR